VICDAMSKK